MRLPAVLLAVLLAACGSPSPSGPGTATLEIGGQRGDCHSFGGCAYVARLEGPTGTSEAEFTLVGAGSLLALGDGLPPVLPNGAYRLTFELRLMSDAIVNDGPQDYGVGATCAAAFDVRSGRSTIHAHVSFGSESCSIDIGSEDLPHAT
ncbi:MAG TPA: hypothetical protein VJ850_05080 [Candidatus Limnocylindrales bacterium]|nr:hypothetical protein [Candidatus Limnocylindrales bacterium]